MYTVLRPYLIMFKATVALVLASIASTDAFTLAGGVTRHTYHTKKSWRGRAGATNPMPQSGWFLPMEPPEDAQRQFWIFFLFGNGGLTLGLSQVMR